MNRDEASKLNPLINSFTEDTLNNVADMLETMGDLMQDVGQTGNGVYCMFAVANAALRYEISNPSLAERS